MKKILLLLPIILIVGCDEPVPNNEIRGYVKDSFGNPVSDARIIHTGYFSPITDWDGEELLPLYTGVTNFNIVVAVSGSVLLWIENFCGDTINIVNDSFLNAGYHSFLWDGNDFNANKVVSGIYKVSYLTSGTFFSQNMIVYPVDLSNLQIQNGELGFFQTNWKDEEERFYLHSYHTTTDINGYFSLPTKCILYWEEDYGLQGEVIIDTTASPDVMIIDELGNLTGTTRIPNKTKLWVVHEGDSTFSTNWYNVDPTTGLEIEIIAPY